MSAAWKSFSTASSMANSATTVFPVPTSPISSRCMRSGAVMSAVISRSACCWSPVSSQGRLLLELSSELPLDGEGHAAPMSLGNRTGPDEHQLKIEQLIERQPPSSPLGLLRGTRAMHCAQRIGQGRAGPDSRRSASGSPSCGQRDQPVEVPVDQRPDDLVAQSFGGGIDRQHLPGGEGVGLAVGVGQDHVLSRCHLPPVIESDRPGDQQGLADRNGAVEKWLSRPDALQHAAVVPQHGVEDPKPAPGRQDALGDDSADAGHLVTQLRLGQRGHGGCVYIAVGKVPQKVARGADAQSLQRLGASLPDSLEELDRRVEANGGRSGAGGIRG